MGLRSPWSDVDEPRTQHDWSLDRLKKPKDKPTPKAFGDRRNLRPAESRRFSESEEVGLGLHHKPRKRKDVRMRQGRQLAARQRP